MLLNKQGFRLSGGTSRPFHQSPIYVASPYHPNDKTINDGRRGGPSFDCTLSAAFRGSSDSRVLQSRAASPCWRVPCWSTITASISCSVPSRISRFSNYYTNLARVRRAERTGALFEGDTVDLGTLSRNAQTPLQDRADAEEFDSSSHSGKGEDPYEILAGSQSENASMSTESEVGIICFVNSCTGFQGVLKQRYVRALISNQTRFPAAMVDHNSKNGIASTV